jgi:arylsulfatase A-like enzyme
MKRTLALALFAVAAQPFAQTGIGVNPPKLVLMISIDQFRNDYVDRFAPYYLPGRSGGRLGGFRYLAETGANFRDAHHNHIPTATGPGHATLMTGSEPNLNGIVGNEWFDRTLAEGKGKAVYCVEDPNVVTVGGTSGPMSPRNLKVTTVGDELKMATNGRSRVVGIAFKDRASILMAGHAADTVIWFDGGTGNWVTSSWYAPNKQLPTWVDRLNREGRVQKLVGKVWEPLLPAPAYANARKAPAEKPSAGVQPFSHPLGATADRNFYGAFTNSSYGNEYVFETVERALDEERLGQRDVPDVLVVNLSTNDYIGHRYGPNSPEVMDISIRTDRLLSNLFNSLQRRIGMDNVAVVVTADHGVLPIVEEARETYRVDAMRVTTNVGRTVEQALDRTLGDGDWVLGNVLYEQNFYLNRATVAAKGLKIEDVERAAAAVASEVPGVYHAFTRTQVMNNGLPRWAWTELLNNGYHPKLSGDLLVIEAPGNYVYPLGTGHGSPWAYDSHVPILVRARGIKPGSYTQRVTTADIAPTLSHLLGIEYPTGNVGKVLPALTK